MLSAELEYLCTEFEFFIEGWNAFYSVGIPFYRVGLLSGGLECSRQSWNIFVQSSNSL
jgi:hypothetical protein